MREFKQAGDVKAGDTLHHVLSNEDGRTSISGTVTVTVNIRGMVQFNLGGNWTVPYSKQAAIEVTL